MYNSNSVTAPDSETGSYSKNFDDLNFTDDFMFCNTLVNNPEICKELAEMIIGRKISRIVSLENQEAIQTTADGKGVRFDVYLEGEDEICDIEMQNDINRAELPKRSRYYQSAIDVDQLTKGTIYQKLKKSYILFICKDKPFAGRELHKFTFRNICVQDPSLELGDETEKIFLTPAGSADDISKEVKEFMTYVADNRATSDFAKRLDDAVEAIKNGEGWRIEYMQLKEKFDKHYNAGMAEGEKKGREEGLKEGHEVGLKEGRKEGLKEAGRKTALVMLKKGTYTHEEIAECSGLPVSVIEEMAKENE